MNRYGIGEWFGHSLTTLSADQRREFAGAALGNGEPPVCPFQNGRPPCRKRGGVCSLQRYTEGEEGRLHQAVGDAVITCPSRFEQDEMLIRWLAEIVGFPHLQTSLAREIPFMESVSTGRPAGKIDLVVATNADNRFEWYGLEIQAVYFSGPGMTSQFEILLQDDDATPPFPDRLRRPDWRSSSAKRLMPQLQVKVPTVRRWGSKMAVAVDATFFDSIGGASANPTQDINDGDIIWLVPELSRNEYGRYSFLRRHWEVLTLEESTNRLLSARTITRSAFEASLLEKLVPLD